jgi:hypothetical protein
MTPTADTDSEYRDLADRWRRDEVLGLDGLFRLNELAARYGNNYLARQTSIVIDRLKDGGT